MTETDISNRIHGELKAVAASYRVLPSSMFDYMRLESHATLQGLPDSNLCVMDGHEIWLELKVYPNMPSPLQIAWACRRISLGHSSIYFVSGIGDALIAQNMGIFMPDSFPKEHCNAHPYEYSEFAKALLSFL